MTAESGARKCAHTKLSVFEVLSLVEKPTVEIIHTDEFGDNWPWAVVVEEFWLDKFANEEAAKRYCKVFKLKHGKKSNVLNYNS